MGFTLLPNPSGIETESVLPLISESAAVGVNPSTKSKVARHVLSGTSALGAGVMIERGAGFAANILAARLGGAATFGAYSLAVTTANNIATYAGAGIGSTAARFSGKYKYGTPAYGTLARVLILVSLISAVAASLGLWLGAAPIARLLGQHGLVGLLRWSALSAAGIVLLECARGFFVGQRRLIALVLMSLIVGLGLLSFLPIAASHHNPVKMIMSQGAIMTAAVLVCLLFARPLGLLSSVTQESYQNFGAMLREVWSFGFVQLAGLVGTNVAGWWLITLVARSDGSLVQMGYFGIASQLRNIVGLAPSLLTEGSFAVMADPAGELSRTPQHVLGWTTFIALFVSFALASLGIIATPWMLHLLYTSAYRHAAIPVAVALALAVVHMGNAPAAARLSILSIRASALINTTWAAFVAISSTVIMHRGGNAATAMSIYLAAHVLSSMLVLFVLSRRNSLPEGMCTIFALAGAASVGLAGLAAIRAYYPQRETTLNFTMLALMLLTSWFLIVIGRRHQWVPTRRVLEQIFQSVSHWISRLVRRIAHAS